MAIEVIENLWIPLADGVRLAARLWRPDDAVANPAPAILEYIPYRKRDGTRGRDEPMHGFFADQGYAAIRVDMRGSGDSDGLLDDEYLLQEQDDALEVIAWLAAQPWCSGVVGMMGKSWGGFNALQVAARRPPALKAIITVCSTDDRFADDIHYMGGCLLNDNLWWGAIMLAYQSRPPDPEIVGEGWRAQWLERLDHLPLWPALWMRNQSRDAYWKHGSINEDFSAITCPVLVIGGWADAYTNAVPRLLEGLRGPRQGLIGPWAHIYPHDGVPGPSVDFLGEATRWWDTWLKGRDTGVMREPMLRAFIENYRKPTTTLSVVEGRFVAEPVWPSSTIAEQLWALAPGRLTRGAADSGTLTVRSPLWTGTTGGEWMGTGVVGEMPADQRMDDGLSLCFDSEPLAADQDVLGCPVAAIDLAADAPHAQLALRLCDVAPDGSSLRVSYAVLNLDHRDGSEAPKPLVPGERVRVRVPLNACGHRFPRGHRIRLTVATAGWPLVWPARDAATVTVFTGASHLTLPVRPDDGEPGLSIAPGRAGSPTPRTLLREGRITRGVSFDHITGAATFTTVGEGGLFGEGVGLWDEIGTAVSHDLTRRLAIGADDPASAEAVIEQSYSLLRDGWAIRVETRLRLTGDRDAFTLEGTLQAFEGDALVAARTWSETIPRVHV